MTDGKRARRQTSSSTKTLLHSGDLRIRLNSEPLYELCISGKWTDVGREAYMAIIETLKLEALAAGADE